jgi:hypothetical protein
MRGCLSIVNKAVIHIDEFPRVNTRSHFLGYGNQVAKPGILYAGKRPFEPTNIAEFSMVTLSIIPGRLVVDVPNNVVQMP